MQNNFENQFMNDPVDASATDDVVIIEAVEKKPKTIDNKTQPIRIRAEQYNELVNVANDTGKQLSELASDLLCYALKHIRIIKK